MPYRRPSLEAFGREESEILAQEAREAFEQAVGEVATYIHERVCSIWITTAFEDHSLWTAPEKAPCRLVRIRLVASYSDLTEAQVEAFAGRSPG